MSIMGTRVIRTEDPRLLTAGGVYVDDLRTPELNAAARLTFVRSPVAHARITGIDASEALSEPGVIAVLTFRDMDDLTPPPPSSGEWDGSPAPLGGPWAEPLLAVDTVRFVGEPVAVVLTDGNYQGEDAANLVAVDYEPLPVVLGPEAAVANETLLFPAAGTNVCVAQPVPADDAPFDACEVVVERDIVNQRVACLPMEGRATAASFENGKLTVWVSSQNAQVSRFILAGALGMAPDQIRVVVPDVGGGFGAKIGIDRDTITIAWAARKTGRSLRWAETRSENLVAMTQGRAQLQHIKVGGSRDGRILAYRIDVIQDIGAYARIGGLLPFLTCLMAPGVYDIPDVQAGFRQAVTNTTPISAYRGAGGPRPRRPSSARSTCSPPRSAWTRRRSGGATSSPRTSSPSRPRPAPCTTPAATRRRWTRRWPQRATRSSARSSSAGGPAVTPSSSASASSSYVEITAPDPDAGETAKIEVTDNGSATVYTGSSAHGQGHHTAWAMLVQDELGIPMDQITVIHGDTDLIPVGVGTYGSRSLQLGGSAVHKAALEVKDEARHHAAEMLEAAEADVVLDTVTGLWQVRGDPDTALSWAQVAGHTSGGSLIADVSFVQDRPTFPFGTHVSVVEVDTETGQVKMLRHVTVDDAGTVVNPVLTEGQRHGGIAQGAAQALLEEVLYDADGNPLTSTLADYAAISPPDLPSFELVASETPTDLNPLGVKGIGEAGSIGSTPAIQNAVVDAVSHLGVRHIDMPATPQRVWTAINDARKASNQ